VKFNLDSIDKHDPLPGSAGMKRNRRGQSAWRIAAWRIAASPPAHPSAYDNAEQPTALSKLDFGVWWCKNIAVDGISAPTNPKF
jgi:hypothetical protein